MNESNFFFFSFSSLTKRFWPSHLTGVHFLILLKTGEVVEVIVRIKGDKCAWKAYFEVLFT